MDRMMYAYPFVTGVSLLVMGVMLIILSARRSTEAQKYVSSVISATFLFFLGFIIYQTGASLDYMLIGIKLEFVAVLTIFIIVFMIFQQVYNVMIPRIPMIAITVWYSFLCMISVMANKDRSGAVFSMLFSDYSLEYYEAGGTYLRLVPAWGWYAVLATLIVIEFITVTIFLRALVISRMHSYKISASFFFITSVPQIFVMVTLFAGINKHHFPFVPVICAAASAGATLMVSKELFSNLYDMAYKEIMNSMQNPLFIIDNSFFVRRVNRAAKAAFPEYRNLDDRSYFKMKASLELQNIITPPLHEAENESRYKTIGKNVYEPEIHNIGHGKHLYGYLLILNNMTEQYSQSSMFQELNHKLSSSLRTSRNRTITSREKLLSGALQFMRDRDPATASHMRRVGNYTFILSRQLRKDGSYTEILTDAYMETLCHVAPLHDIGKYLLPQEMLRGNGVEPEERQQMQSHTTLGAQIIDRMIVNNYDDTYYRLAHEVALFHHEHWDGSGYMQGLSGEEIPLSARIVAGADKFDKLAMNGENRDFEEVFKKMMESEKGILDPLVLEAILHGKEEFREMYEQVKSEGL